MSLLSPTLSCVMLCLFCEVDCSHAVWNETLMQASNTVYATKNCILLKINLHTSYAFGGYRHFTQVSLNMALLIVQHFTKDVPRPKVLPSTTLAHLLIL